MDSMRGPQRRLHAHFIRALHVIAMLVVSASAHAQSPPASWPTLNLRVGEKIIVTGGAIDDPLSGRIIHIADDVLVLADGSTQHRLVLSGVDLVERPRDRIWNGALSGYGVGLIAGVALVLADPCTPQPGSAFNVCFNDPGFAFFFGGVVTGPVGMGIGAIADALVGRPRVVFDRRSAEPHALTVRSRLAPDGGSMHVAISF